VVDRLGDRQSGGFMDILLEMLLRVVLHAIEEISRNASGGERR
jgi:hypothetical protein